MNIVVDGSSDNMNRELNRTNWWRVLLNWMHQPTNQPTDHHVRILLSAIQFRIPIAHHHRTVPMPLAIPRQQQHVASGCWTSSIWKSAAVEHRLPGLSQLKIDGRWIDAISLVGHLKYLPDWKSWVWIRSGMMCSYPATAINCRTIFEWRL